MSPLLLLVAILLLIIYIYHYAVSRPPNFPPGPVRLPVFGSYLQLLAGNYRYPYKIIDKMTSKYKSKILGFYLGSIPTIVACDFESIKEILVRPEFQGRFDSVVTRTRALGDRLGVFFVDGPYWAEQRRFALRHMRDFGFGRRSETLESQIEIEIRDIIDIMQGSRKDEKVHKNGLTYLPDVFYPGFINSILVVLMGIRFSRDEDEKLRFLGNKTMLFQRSGDTTGGFLTHIPWIRFFAPKLSGHHSNQISSYHLQKFMRELIEEHKTSYSEEYMRDFCDTYIRELKLQQASADITTFSDDQLLLTAIDFFFPAATAISTTLVQAIIYMMHYPEICSNVQKELDTVVGRNKLPSLNDRPSLPYTEATLRESMRRTTLTPISVPHRATEDTYFRGYFVPKNTMMITCLWSMHMDKDFWGDPEVFRPERFLDEKGLLKKKDYTLPFGAGKRLCAGETFARQNLFLFFAAMMQNFNFEMPDGKELPDINHQIPGIIESPYEFWVRAIPRL
ncbi:probable cytochrome P450 304a1 [Anabrus simplex]|uniref:probable cytochrome P450 304a1 n=1 Tax=Anabrus simplex TaxID=316456 RepID=UPI0035A289D9